MNPPTPLVSFVREGMRHVAALRQRKSTGGEDIDSRERIRRAAALARTNDRSLGRPVGMGRPVWRGFSRRKSGCCKRGFVAPVLASVGALTGPLRAASRFRARRCPARIRASLPGPPRQVAPGASLALERARGMVRCFQSLALELAECCEDRALRYANATARKCVGREFSRRPGG